MLSVQEINAAYGNLSALEQVSVEVGSGQTVVVVGPNGAGKTTLLSSITGLVKPFSGKIIFRDTRIDGMEPHKIVNMGISYSLEGAHLFRGLTVYENLIIGSYNHYARKQVKEKLSVVFSLFPILEERKKQLAGTLSGGERQMLSIARCLMSCPSLILLDEPSSGLAPKIVNQTYEHIKEIKSQGYSILLVEQNARKALQVADYVYLLVAGRLEFKGTPEEFRSVPEIERTYLGEKSLGTI